MNIFTFQAIYLTGFECIFVGKRKHLDIYTHTNTVHEYTSVFDFTVDWECHTVCLEGAKARQHKCHKEGDEKWGYVRRIAFVDVKSLQSFIYFHSFIYFERVHLFILENVQSFICFEKCPIIYLISTIYLFWKAPIIHLFPTIFWFWKVSKH